MPLYRSRAPLRISFAGGGTDLPPYCFEHGGQVTSTTIDKYVHVTAEFTPKERSPNEIRIFAYDLGQKLSIPIGNYEFNGSFDLIKAVLKHFQISVPGTLYIHSDLPAGSGMGTSSSLVVALIKVCAEYLQINLSKQEIARLACKIEREDLKETGGFQDQYAASFGGFNFITFNREIQVHPLTIPSPFIDELASRLVLCYTGNSHISAEIQKTVIQNYRQLSFHESMTELKQYAVDLRDLLVRADLNQIDDFGRILHNAWLAKKRLSAKITTDSIEQLYLHSLKHGAIGGKLLGAGGGGFLLLFTHPLQRITLIKELQRNGGEIVDFHFESQGVQSWQLPM